MSASTGSQAIDAVLAEAVAAGAVPAVVAVAADRDGVIYEGAAGPRAPGEAAAIDVDTPVRVMSMTKPVVTVAALQLAEQRKLDLDAPVEEYVPEFAALGLLERIDDGRPVLRVPSQKATVKQLITHTAGLGYWFWDAAVLAWERAVGAPKPMSGLRAVLDAPLVAEPGSAFEYSNATDWLGLAIEAVCGHSLDQVVSDIVTEPLGMTRTGFALDDRARAALVPVHLRAADGRWAASEIELPARPEYVSGSRGLYSTARDYLVFQRMLLGEGSGPEGATVLSPDSVRAMFANQIGALDFPAEIRTADPEVACGLALGPGYKWGHGVLLNSAGTPGRRHAGSGGWMGLFNTFFWVDLDAGVTGALFTQTLPFLDRGAWRLAQDFETALYASL